MLKIDDTFAEDKIKFHHLYAAPLYGDNGRLPSVMVKSDYTCTPSSGEVSEMMCRSGLVFDFLTPNSRRTNQTQSSDTTLK